VAIYHALVNTLVEARHIQVASVLLVLATGGLVLATLLGTNWGADKETLPFVGSLSRRLPTLVSPFWKPGGLNPAPVGASLAILVPIPIAFLLGARKWTIRILAAAAALAGSLVLLFSQSRSGLLGFTLALLAMGVAYARRFMVVVVIVAIFGLGAIFVADSFPTDRLLGAAGGGSALEGLEGRLEIWSRALYMIQDFPLTGVGLGMFDPVLDMLYPLFSHDPSTRVYHAHNILLAQAVTVGLPGLVAFGSMLLLLLVVAFQCVRLARSGPFRPLAIGLLGAVTGYLGHGVFDSTDSLIRVNTIVWMIFGLQTALWLHLNSELLPRAEPEARMAGAISEPDGSLERSG
jgi:putative inorganic carbon (HCO3(-)) transporter